MPPQQINLTECEKEALAIRWRRILILALLDYFNGSNDFGILILKELVDLREAILKAYAKNNGVDLRDNNSWKPLSKIIHELMNKVDIPETVKDTIRQSEDVVINQRISSQLSIKDLRNEETHYLNVLDVRPETVLRIWRMFYDFVKVVDPEFFDYVKDRPELCDFYHLQDFFWRIVICQERVDLSKLKQKIVYVPIGKGKSKTFSVEKDVWEIINDIKSGNYCI